MTTTQLERRLTAVEQKLARLMAEQADSAQHEHHPLRSLEKIHGTFSDDDAFREATRLGRQWRDSLDAPPRRKSRRKRS